MNKKIDDRYDKLSIISVNYRIYVVIWVFNVKIFNFCDY